jgi:hypothetical protein
MYSFRFLCSLFLLAACAPAASLAQAAPAGSPNAPRTVALTLPAGTPIQIALDQEVRVRRVGQPIHGRVMQPVYAFDHQVIPVGTEALGRITAREPVPAGKRAWDALNANFTPAHPLGVTFDELIFPDGRHLPLQTTVAPGSGTVIRLVSSGAHKKNLVKDAAAQKMDQVRAQWRDALKQIHSPGKVHLVVHSIVQQLPVHPQYIQAGTFYSADLDRPLDFGSETLAPSSLSYIGEQPPPGSLVHATLITPLSSATAKKGETVEAVLSAPLVDHGHLILPTGTRLRGAVLQVRPARRLHRNGQLRVSFREIIPPNGVAQTVETGLEGIEADAASNVKLDSEGGARGTQSKSQYLAPAVSVGLALIGSGGRNDVGVASPIAGGATGFKLIGLIVGSIYQNHNYGILLSAYGGGRAVYSTFLGRGRNIVFAKDTVMEVGVGNRRALPLPAVH